MNDTQKLAEIYKQMRLDEAKKKMDPVGDADADIDNDGDVDDSDEYLHKRRKAIKKSMKEEMCPKCECDPCECDSKEESVEIDTDDGEVTKAKDDKKKKKPDTEAETDMTEAKNPPLVMNAIKDAMSSLGSAKSSLTAAKGKHADNAVKRKANIAIKAISDAMAAMSMKEEVEIEEAAKPKGKTLSPKDIKRALASKGAQAKSKDKVTLKKAPWESKEVEEAALTVGMKQPVDIDDTEEKGHMDAVKANKAGPTAKQPKKIKELRK